MKTGILLLSASGLLIGSLQAQHTVENFNQLKELQTKVKSVVEKNMGATISIMTKRGAAGSGVIISEDGLILTAAHVIKGSKEVTIIFPDGKTAKAKVLGANFTKDSAMCKMVNPGPWKFAEVADSKDMKIGDYVVAMGHAGGFDAVRTPPVRFGRLLSKNRRGYITSDCTLIGGDSGGPLYDIKGRVVGIHSNIGALWSTNNHAGTSGFKADWERLKKGDQWGSMGSNPLADPDSPVFGVQLGQTKDGGVEIVKVIKNGPAFKAGLKDGDVVLKINGTSVKNRRELVGRIHKNEPGDSVKLDVKRGEKVIKIDLTLGRRGAMNNNFKK